jgi:hypothetical protein
MKGELERMWKKAQFIGLRAPLQMLLKVLGIWIKLVWTGRTWFELGSFRMHDKHTTADQRSARRLVGENILITQLLKYTHNFGRMLTVFHYYSNTYLCVSFIPYPLTVTMLLIRRR